MRVGDFEVRVVGGREEGAEPTVIFLQHGQVYQLVLANRLKRQRCDVRLKIDGKEMGTFRLLAESSLTLERPTNQEGKFTFFSLGTPEAAKAQIPSDGRAGLVTVQFVPEALTRGKLFVDDMTTLGAPRVMPIDEEAGGTGFTGKSEQSFQDADDIYTYEPSASIHIELRLRGEADLDLGDMTLTSTLHRLQAQVDALTRDIEAAENGEDYLAPDHFKKLRRLANLEMDLKLARRDVAQAATHADYETLPVVLVTCPDCQKDSKVPQGAGRIRIKCPHCTCQFVRKA